eukprot:scaffold27561_cov74-Cyclotella_meneghiniana.AAC.6
MSNPNGFRGFADFANTSGSTSAAVLAAARSKKQNSATPTDSKPSIIRASPIYSGSDQRLIVLFRKIGQKRDATTKIRALEELANSVFSPNQENDDYSRKEKIASLSHLVFLHETKLGYDNNPAVRAGSYKLLVAMKCHVPKAWNGFFTGEDGGESSIAGANTVGMAWATAKGDPSSEVARLASEFINQLSSGDSKQIPSSIQTAVLHYSKLILECKRASALQDVINPVSSASFHSNSGNTSGGKDKKKGAKPSVKESESSAAQAESEREEMEERYERLTLSVLIGLGFLVESQPETTTSQCYVSIEHFPESASITRLMQSSRASFRRESYNLVGRFCQFAPSLVLLSNTESTKITPLATIMPNLISGEKDSSNFVALLELVLSHLSVFRNNASKDGSTENPWNAMDAFAFVKALSKSLRKACYGSPATSWAQMILPIVASLPCNVDEEQQSPLVIVESLWEGRKSAINTFDASAIVSSVVECVTYLLLRRSNESKSLTSHSSMACGQLFLDCLSYFLNEATTSSLDDLCATISCDIARLDAASVDDGVNDRGIAHVKTFLWSESGMHKTLLTTRDRQTDLKLNRLMTKLIEIRNQNNNQHLCNIISSSRALFNAIIIHSDSRGNKSCTRDEVEILLGIIHICGAQTLFPIQKPTQTLNGIEQASLTIEEFCVNNIIRWILVHAQSEPLAIPADFNIAKHLLLSIQSSHQQKHVWETILRELIKSYCDVTTLATGFCAMTSDSDEKLVVELIRCHTLDQFAVELCDAFMDSFWRSHDLTYIDEKDNCSIEHPGDMCLFFRSCVGLPDCKSMLVSTSVINHWVDRCCDERFTEKLLMEDETGSNALLQTLLLLGSSNGKEVFSQNELSKLIIESWHKGGAVWEEIALKKYDLNVESSSDKYSLRNDFTSNATAYLHKTIRRKPSLDHAIMELTSQSWSKKAARLLNTSKTSGLEIVGIDLDLYKVYQKANEPSTAESLFLTLMYLLHDINDPGRCRELLLEKSRNLELFVYIQSTITSPSDPLLHSFDERTQKNRQLVEILGGNRELYIHAQEFTINCIDILAHSMKEPIANAQICRQMVTTLSYLVSLLFTAKWSEESSDDCILAEDIKEGDSLWYEKTDGVRIKAQVLKVHTDDFPNLYFTIREDSSSEERQTISRRLKRHSAAPSQTFLNENDTNSRELISRRLMDQLVKPFITNLNLDKHADISVQNELSAECINIIVSQIGLISVGIGSIRYELIQLQSSLERRLCEAIVDIDQNFGQVSSLIGLIGLMLGGLYTKNPPLGGNIGDLKISTDGIYLSLLDLYDEHSQFLKAKSGFHKNVTMWLAVTLCEVKDCDILVRLTDLLLILCDELLVDDAGSSILLLKCVVTFQASARSCLDYRCADSRNEQIIFEKITKSFVDISDTTKIWMDTYAAVLKHYMNVAPKILLYSANTFSESLICDCLKSVKKQWCAFQLLMVLAKENEPSEPHDDTILSPATQKQLLDWKSDLDEEEASDLEDDVKAKTNAIGFIMDRAMKEANLDIGRKENIFQCIDSKNCHLEFALKEIATLAVFRTVEVVPTLSKTWYNDDCPRYLQQQLMHFVENKVAPETLSRELERIKDATSFGEMTVTGSRLTREVIATYHQDECQLSVTVRVPPAFPLRNVEVDLGKTLGIAEKRWRRWSLNIMMMLNNQDGSILDALLLWKENVDKEFEGVEPCPVCYSVLCIKTHSMPNLQCKTCNNKFHSLCLHKWFQSSGKSNCVLCQQPWSGTKLV